MRPFAPTGKAKRQPRKETREYDDRTNATLTEELYQKQNRPMRADEQMRDKQQAMATQNPYFAFPPPAISPKSMM